MPTDQASAERRARSSARPKRAEAALTDCAFTPMSIEPSSEDYEEIVRHLLKQTESYAGKDHVQQVLHDMTTNPSLAEMFHLDCAGELHLRQNGPAALERMVHELSQGKSSYFRGLLVSCVIDRSSRRDDSITSVCCQ